MSEAMVKPPQLTGFVLSDSGQVFCDRRGFVGVVVPESIGGLSLWLAVAKDGRRRRFNPNEFAMACEWLTICAGSPRGDVGRIKGTT